MWVTPPSKHIKKAIKGFAATVKSELLLLPLFSVPNFALLLSFI